MTAQRAVGDLRPTVIDLGIVAALQYRYLNSSAGAPFRAFSAWEPRQC